MVVAPKGHLLHLYIGKDRIGQGEGMFPQVLYLRICSPSGAFCEGVNVDQIWGTPAHAPPPAPTGGIWLRAHVAVGG